MNNSLFMSRRQSMSDLDGIVDRFTNRQRAALQQLAQRAALEQLGYQIRRAFEDAELVDGKNVGMVQSGCGLRLPPQPRQPVGILPNKVPPDPAPPLSLLHP